MKIENIVEPAARLEREVLETRCILVQILEVLKSRHRWEEAGEKEGEQRLKLLSTQPDTPNLDTKIAAAKNKRQTCRENKETVERVMKAFADCSKKFSSMQMELASIRIGVKQALGDGVGVKPQTSVDGENVSVAEPFTDDGFFEVQNKMKRTSNVFNRLEITSRALSQAPDAIEGFKSKRKKLEERVKKFKENTPEYDTAKKMLDVVTEHIKTVPGRMSVLLKDHGETVRAVSNRLIGLTEPVEHAVRQCGQCKVAREAMPELDRTFASLKETYNSTRGER